ncbi:MAG: hypothetical protein J1E98_00265 [Lachnospiraceae bacterium]|nr:hypothetical protein [Lachnospiraceae bacterium]
MNAWENLIQLFTQIDIGNRVFEEALQKIGEYLKDLSEHTRVQAETVCNDAANTLLGVRGVKSNLTEEDLQCFYERKIDAADYCAPFDSFRSVLRSDADSLCTMREYLKCQPQTESVLRQTYLMNCRSHLLSKQIDYIGLNHFSVESKLTETETSKFKNMLETLPTFSQVAVWETDLPILNAKLEKIFQDYEREVSQYSRTVGENFSDYLKEKENAAEKLKMVGYDDDVFEELVSKIERNVEMLGRITRLERLELCKKADS